MTELYKAKGRDIVEIFANSLNCNKKLEPFNLSEWYGFSNSDDSIKIRAKLLSTCDSNRNYNLHKAKNDEFLEKELYCIIQTHNKFTVVKIVQFNSNKIIFNDDLTLKSGGEEDKSFIRIEFDFDDSVYKIQSINESIYSIKQRVTEQNQVDEEAIKQLFDNESSNSCAYCGVSQKQIKKIDDFLKENKISDYGLTIRERGKKLEIDQLNPKMGYVKNNIALSCYWCNNAKTDTFSPKEFKPIARGINQIWNQKLKDTGSKENICFPENSFIWNVDIK
jgi:hypothetical protein